MNVSKQMCWCFKVFFGVFGNLARRLFAEILYRVRSLCCCRTKSDSSAMHCWMESVVPNSEEFYKHVDREEAEVLLTNKQNGTFVVRPSRSSNLGTLSLVQDDKMFHLNIRLRDDGLVALGAEKIDEKCFADVDGLINYYISNYLVLYSKGEKSLALLLPYREKTVC